MKAYIFCLLPAILIACTSCRPARPAAQTPAVSEQAHPQAGASQPKKVPKTAPQPQQSPQADFISHEPAPKSTISSEVQGVINYGIGATQMRAKQKATSKIKNINEQHNRELEEALR